MLRWVEQGMSGLSQALSSHMIPCPPTSPSLQYWVGLSPIALSFSPARAAPSTSPRSAAHKNCDKAGAQEPNVSSAPRRLPGSSFLTDTFASSLPTASLTLPYAQSLESPLDPTYLTASSWTLLSYKNHETITPPLFYLPSLPSQLRF